MSAYLNEAKGSGIMTRITLLLLTVLLTTPAAYADGLDVHLAFEPSSTLPGVPVTIAVKIRNTADAAIPISAHHLHFTVTFPDGSVSEIPAYVFEFGAKEPLKKHANAVLLPPGQAAWMYWRPNQSFDAPLFDNPKLNRPGVYDVAVSIKGTADRLWTSNHASLTIRVPEGDDKAIWDSVQPTFEDRGKGPWDLMPAVCGMLDRYPSSNYYRLVRPWCLMEVPARNSVAIEEYGERILGSADAMPGATRDAVLVSVPGFYAIAAQTASSNNDPAEAARLSVLGAAVLERVTKQVSTEYGAIDVAALRGVFLTEPEWRERRIAQTRPALAPRQLITPFVNCVTDSADGTFSAEFGYDNPNRTFIDAPAGRDNALLNRFKTPATIPTRLSPGRVDRAFTVKNARGSVTWKLNGISVTANPASAPRCSEVNIDE